VVAATGAASQSDLYGVWHSALVFTSSPDARVGHPGGTDPSDQRPE
jgi:hypothetical protein